MARVELFCKSKVLLPPNMQKAVTKKLSGGKKAVSETRIAMLQNYTGFMKTYFANIYS